MLVAFLRSLFFLVIVRPLVLVVMGLNVRHRDRLPTRGPAILIANHNSHLDTIVLMTLYKQRDLDCLRPAAAAEYFLKHRWLSWFAKNIIQIIPLERGSRDVDETLAGIYAALEDDKILILFPEGTRGEPETRTAFKKGIARIARRYPTVPITPIFMHGLGKALPKGEGLLVPCFCDVFIGEAVRADQAGDELLGRLEASMKAIALEGQFPSWD